MGLKSLFLFFTLLVCVSFHGLAQVDSTATDSSDIEDNGDYESTWAVPKSEDRFKVGIKMGIQACTLLGSELPNPRVSIGMLGGGYARYNFKNKLDQHTGWSVQTEVQVSFRGSNFKVPSTSTTDIATLRLLYFDLPLFVLRALDKKRVHRAGVGMQFSTIINTSMYKATAKYPTSVTPAVNPFDFAAVLIYQYHVPFFTIQGAVKGGLTNINSNKAWPDGTPVNTGGTIRNFVVEFNFLF